MFFKAHEYADTNALFLKSEWQLFWQYFDTNLDSKFDMNRKRFNC